MMKNLLLGIDVVWLEAECSRYEFFIDVASQTQPDIAFVALDGDPQKGLDLVRQLGVANPGCSILVSSNSTRLPGRQPADHRRPKSICS